MNSFSIFFKKTAGYHTIVYEDGDVKNYKIISEPNENGSLRAPNNDQMVDIHTITVTEWCPNQLVIMAAAGGGNLQQKLQPGQMVIMRMSSGEATMEGLWNENGQECPGTPQDQLNFSKGSKMKVASVRGAFFTSEQFSSLWVPVKCVDGVGGVSGGGMFGGGGGAGGGGAGGGARMCYAYQKGNCDRGANCRFSHDDDGGAPAAGGFNFGGGGAAAGGMGGMGKCIPGGIVQKLGGGFGHPAAGGMFGGQPKPAMGGGMGGGGMGFGNPAAGGSIFGGTGATGGPGATGATDFSSVYEKLSTHPDAKNALEKLARVDWACLVAKELKAGVSQKAYMTNFPFEFMFYDNLVSWVADEQNGKKKYVARSDGNNKSQQSQMASMGAGASMFGNSGGGFGNTNGMQNRQLTSGGGSKTSFTELWNLARKGPQGGGISHEKFIDHAVNYHMKGKQGDYPFISDKLWAQALANTVINGVKVFPHPIVGFDQLNKRIQTQRETATQLNQQATQLKDIAASNKATLIRTKIKIQNQKRQQLVVREKLMRVMRMVEKLHYWNQPTTKNDILFRQRMNGLWSELNLPHRFHGQLEELESQMANRTIQNGGSEQLHLSKMDKERVFDFLTQQQRGLHQLTEIVRKDARDLLIMRNRSIMEIKQAQKNLKNGGGGGGNRW